MLWMHEELDRGYRTKQLHEEFYVLFFSLFCVLKKEEFYIAIMNTKIKT